MNHYTIYAFGELFQRMPEEEYKQLIISQLYYDYCIGNYRLDMWYVVDFCDKLKYNYGINIDYVLIADMTKYISNVLRIHNRITKINNILN